jgi:hypothetical protein
MTGITSEINNIWHEVVCPNCSVSAQGGYTIGDAVTGAIKEGFVLHKNEAFCNPACVVQWEDRIK